MTVRAILIALLGALATLALIAPTASAGTYTVHACDPNVGNVNNSFAPYADQLMDAYTGCGGEGLVARNVFDGGTSGQGARAAMIFDAPPGAIVRSVATQVAITRPNCAWSTILVASGQDFGGQAIGGYGAGQNCDGPYAFDNTYFAPGGIGVNVYNTRFRIESQCVYASCARNGRAAIRLTNTRVEVQDDVPPVIASATGDLWTSDGWVGGQQRLTVTATDNTGIRSQRVLVDGREIIRRSHPCDPTQRAPCPGTASFDPNLATRDLGVDGEHRVRIEAEDTGGVGGAAERTVRLDNTPPDPPASIRVDGGDGWRATNGFGIAWTNPTERFAPIGAAEYELCRDETKDCITRVVIGRAITKLDDVKVPGAGEWTMRLWLHDTAGNRDKRLAATPLKLRFDDTAPVPTIERLQADDPTKLVVSTTDTGAPLAGGTVELLRRGSQRWRPQAVTVDGTQLVARIDDERLLDGAYLVRARAADAAGNQRETTLHPDGAQAEVRMPIRLKTGMRTGIKRGRGKKARLARAANVAYGQRVRVAGRLTSTEGNPLEATEIQAFSDVKDGIPGANLIATVKTSRTGRFSFLMRKGPSRTVTVRYGGTARVRTATRTLQLNVRSSTSMRPDRRRLANGETVNLRGKIRTGRLPSLGKLVEMQVFVRRRWRTFATTRTTRTGSWNYDYRFDGTTGSQRYRFRARIPREAGYPYATGRSRVTSVRVRG